jgi:gliding motility-associated-like protein
LGCTSTATATIGTSGAPFVFINGNSTICTGGSSTLSTISGGGTSYSWSTGATTPAITVSPTVTTTYTLVGSVGFCHDTAFKTVYVYPPPIASINGSTTICSGYPATLSASGGNNNVPYSYLWNTGSQATSITVNPTTTSTYTVTISLGSACKDTATATLYTVPSPTATITGNTTLCGGNSATLTASGGNYYVWSNNSSATTITVTPAVSSTYSVTTGNGFCTHDTSVLVFVSPPPVASITGPHDICDGSSGTFSGHGGGTYAWNTGSTNAVINPTTAGNYSVVVTIGACTDTAYTNLVVHPLPTVDASADVTIVQGQSTDISATGANVYVWNGFAPGQSMSVSPQYTSVYCVTGTDANNCSDTACVEVHVISCETAGELFLPTAFSPNRDGENDSLQIFYGLFDCIKKFHLKIFNRWGEKIYSTDDPYFKWSGAYNTGILKETEEPQTEVFVYYLEVEFGDFSKIERKGNISLLR